VLVRRRLALLRMIYTIRMRSSSDIVRFRRKCWKQNVQSVSNLNVKTPGAYSYMIHSHLSPSSPPFSFSLSLSLSVFLFLLLYFSLLRSVTPRHYFRQQKISRLHRLKPAHKTVAVFQRRKERSDVLIIRFTTLAGNSARGHDIKVTAGTRGCMRRGYTRAPAAVTAEKNQFRESSTVRYKTGWPSPFFSQLAENSSPWNSVLLQFRAFSLT